MAFRRGDTEAVMVGGTTYREPTDDAMVGALLEASTQLSIQSLVRAILTRR